MNTEDENNVDSLLDDLFRVCHGNIIRKNVLLDESDEDAIRRCYLKYMRCYSLVTQMGYFVERRSQRNKENGGK